MLGRVVETMCRRNFIKNSKSEPQLGISFLQRIGELALLLHFFVGGSKRHVVLAGVVLPAFWMRKYCWYLLLKLLELCLCCCWFKGKCETWGSRNSWLEAQSSPGVDSLNTSTTRDLAGSVGHLQVPAVGDTQIVGLCLDCPADHWNQ